MDLKEWKKEVYFAVIYFQMKQEKECVLSSEDNGLGMSQEKVDEFNDRERAGKNRQRKCRTPQCFFEDENFSYGNKAEWTV